MEAVAHRQRTATNFFFSNCFFCLFRILNRHRWEEAVCIEICVCFSYQSPSRTSDHFACSAIYHLRNLAYFLGDRTKGTGYLAFFFLTALHFLYWFTTQRMGRQRALLQNPSYLFGQLFCSFSKTATLVARRSRTA